MHQVDIHEAETQLSKLIEQALSGEEVIIVRGDKPVVKLVPLSQQESERLSAAARGEQSIADDFSDYM